MGWALQDSGSCDRKIVGFKSPLAHGVLPCREDHIRDYVHSE